MDFFEQLQQKWNIDLVIFSLVMLSGFFQERFLGHWKIVKDSRLCAALKTLIVSLGVSSIYIVITYNQLKQGAAEGTEVLIPWGKYFITFFATTSIYDLVVRPFRKWISKVTGNTDEEKEKTTVVKP